MRFRFPAAHIQSRLAEDRLRGHHIDAVDVRQVYASKPQQFAAQIKGRGVSKRGGSARGDLFVTLDVVIPTRLTREQKELLAKLASTLETENKPINKKILERVKEIFS